MSLNEEQLAAVEHRIGHPACLIAGAGSGKTRVLTERVRWLIGQGVPPRRIVAITFTNKAAGELVSRLGLTDETPPEMLPRVSTIHSLALNGIRKDPRAFGLQNKVTPLDDYDQTQMLKKIIERRKNESEQINVYGVLEKIKYHRARGVGFRVDYTAEVHDAALRAHSGYHALDKIDLELWEEFQAEKTRNSTVDFDDMLHLVVRRMHSDPRWLEVLQRQFDHVLMDEAQDTSECQWKFVNGLLGPENRNLYVVGDVSQSIYAFSGASPALLIGYSEAWRDLIPNLYRIARNHRSVPEIVKFANLIQSKMTHTIPLTMESWRGIQNESGLIKKVTACLPQDIAFTMAAEIQKDASRRKDSIAYKDNAILVRAAAQIRDIEGELVKRRIPYVVRGGRGLLQTEEVRDVLAYLRLAANHKDFMALVRATGAPKRGVGEVALEKVREKANREFDGDLVQAARALPKLFLFCDVIDHITLFKDAPNTALEKIMTSISYRDYIANKYRRDPDKVKSKNDNLDRFIMMIAMLTEDGNVTTDDLIFQLTMERPQENERIRVEQMFISGQITEAERNAKIAVIENGSVTISTIHSSKGLEWRRVYVTNLNEGSLPHKFSMGSTEEIEEERRLFYVACTRARDVLVLCVPEMTQVQANTNKLTPSRFLAEIGIG